MAAYPLVIKSGAFRPENENGSDHPGLDLFEIGLQRMLEIVSIVILIGKYAMFRNLLPDKGAEEIIICHPFAQDIRSVDDTVRGHIAFDVAEYLALVLNGRTNAMEKIVHADRVEFVVQRKRSKDVGEDATSVGTSGSLPGDVQSSLFIIDKGQIRRLWHITLFEIVARADANVEMILPHIVSEERNEIVRRVAAPPVRSNHTQDPPIIEC